MSDHQHHGPLHLQRYLAPCTDAIANVIRSSVQHPVTAITSLECNCAQTVLLSPKRSSHTHQAPAHAAGSEVEKRTSEVRRRNIESARLAGDTPQPEGQGPGPSAASPPQSSGPKLPAQTPKAAKACGFFALQMNDEQGVLHAFCRRCNRRILVYDRELYWGVKRQSNGTPPTYPYQCSCGGHTFEIALGFEYPDDAIDENDLETITVAVKCAGCNEVAVVFDDEAT